MIETPNSNVKNNRFPLLMIDDNFSFQTKRVAKHTSFFARRTLEEATTLKLMKAENIFNSWRIKVAIVIGFWTLTGLFFSSQLYFDGFFTSRRITFGKALAWQMFAAYALALATPLVVWLARRFSFGRGAWWRILLVHLVAGFLFSVVLAAIHVTNDAAHIGGFQSITRMRIARGVIYLLDKEMMFYWSLVLTIHAFDYYRNLKANQLRFAQLEIQLAQAEVQALKMQLHPHFLFNTLNSISALMHEDIQAADRMVARLGDFLRLTLANSGEQEVTLQQEMEFLTRYLEIESVRFQDRLTVRTEIESETLEARVPNLILQPIIENAIRHGISRQSTPGKLFIRAARLNDKLQMHVEDNGQGLSASGNGDNAHSGGIGLSNTRARLSHLYANDYRLEMTAAVPHGLIVMIEIPFARGGAAHLKRTNAR